MKEKQEVKTIDLVLSLIMVTIMIAVVGTILNEKLKNPIVTAAQEKAEKISNQMLSGGLTQLGDTVQRDPSSVYSFQTNVIETIGEEGQIAKDPWGNPYQFKFIRGKNKEFKYLVVWSLGPNQKADTQPNQIVSTARFRGAGSFSGDDVGFLSVID